MNDTLTLETLNKARASLGPTALLGAPVIRVFDFTEQWRFPRTKNRRIRKKWSKRKANWRPKLGQCYQMNLPRHPPTVVMGPDVKRQLDRRLSSPNNQLSELSKYTKYLPTTKPTSYKDPQMGNQTTVGSYQVMRGACDARQRRWGSKSLDRPINKDEARFFAYHRRMGSTRPWMDVIEERAVKAKEKEKARKKERIDYYE